MDPSAEEHAVEVANPPAAEAGDDGTEIKVPDELPVLPIRDMVVFPGTVVPLRITRAKSKQLVNDVLAGDRLLAVAAQIEEQTEDPDLDHMFRVGTACQVLKLLPMPDGSANLIVHGITRVGIEEILTKDPYWRARLNARPDQVEPSMEIEALAFNARRTAE